MRTFDLSPLYRSTVGFDQFADLLDRVFTTDIQQHNSYPPFNIKKTAQDAYRISIAAAGFSQDELSVEVREQALIVAARKTTSAGNRVYLHRGIAERSFEKRFQMAEHIQVTRAAHENGMLHIDLVREVPEALKPRQIAITPVANTSEPVLETTAAA